MATRGNDPPHDHHRPFRGVLEAQMDVVGGLHVCSNRPGDKRARNNKKKVKTGKSASITKVPKNRKEGKQHKNSEKKHRKENKKTEQATKHSAIVPTSQNKKEADGNNNKLCGTGNFSGENLPQQNSAKLE